VFLYELFFVIFCTFVLLFFSVRTWVFWGGLFFSSFFLIFLGYSFLNSFFVVFCEIVAFMSIWSGLGFFRNDFSSSEFLSRV